MNQQHQTTYLGAEEKHLNAMGAGTPPDASWWKKALEEVDRLLWFQYPSVRNREDDDIRSEVMVRLVRRLSRPDLKPITDLAPFLQRVTKNTAINALKRRNKREVTGEQALLDVPQATNEEDGVNWCFEDFLAYLDLQGKGELMELARLLLNSTLTTKQRREILGVKTDHEWKKLRNSFRLMLEQFCKLRGVTYNLRKRGNNKPAPRPRKKLSP